MGRGVMVLRVATVASSVDGLGRRAREQRLQAIRCPRRAAREFYGRRLAFDFFSPFFFQTVLASSLTPLWRPGSQVYTVGGVGQDALAPEICRAMRLTMA